MASKRYVCIICPNSCEIDVEYSGNVIQKISGQTCKRGDEYVRKEMTAPERGVTTSVPIRGGAIPLVSVRSSKTIPKELLPKAIQEISKARAVAPVKIGDILIKNLLGTGADIIATKNVPQRKA
jgi:CxxC motif-containing protein